MAEKNKVGEILSSIPVPVWLGAFGLLAAGSVWNDAKEGAKDLGKKTGAAFEEVERSKSYLIDLPEFKRNYFSEYIPKGTKVKLMKQAEAVKLAEDLKRVKGFFNDNEELLYSVFSKIGYLTQLAQVAQKFTELTNKNLGAYIVSFTNTNERHRIEKMIAGMKNGLL